MKEEERERQELSEKKKAVAAAILSKRDEAVAHRSASGIERIWAEDEKLIDLFDSAYTMSSMLDYATKTAPPPRGSNRRSGIIIHPVRRKCEIATARLRDKALPTDQKNWGLKVTPVSELVDGEKDHRVAYQNGEPIKMGAGVARVSDVVQDIQNRARERMLKMETLIDDQLVECDFNAELRKVIKNAVFKGTGAIKGPCVTKDLRKVWKRNELGEYGLEISEEIRPISRSVDPRCLFPDPECGADIKRAGYMWELDTVLPHELASYIGVPGYDEKAITEILEEEPSCVGAHFDKITGSYRTHDRRKKGGAYERWEYNGGITRSDLEVLGCDCEKLGVKAAQTTASIIFINDRPIKVSINHLDTNELPYDFFQWTEISDCPFGAGIPRVAAELVRVIIASWQAMMDNAGDSAGVNVVMGSGIRPVDGKWELTGKKAWMADEESAIEDIRKAFAQFQVENNQQQFQAIIDMAMEQLDLETGVPTIFEGEQQKQPETLGQSNIVVDSSNIIFRDRVKMFADKIIDPHITRYYNHNMQYHEDDSVKGDYKVDVSAVSALLERDTQVQSLFGLFQLKADPDISVNTDWDKVVKQIFMNQKLDVLTSEKERKKRRGLMAQQQGQGNPSLQIAQIRIQGDIEKEKMRIQAAEQEDMRKAQQAEREWGYRLQIEQMKKEMAIMELAQSSQMSIERIKADLAKDSAKINLQRELSTSGNGKAEQVITPPSEPPQRAQDGRAFQE